MTEIIRQDSFTLGTPATTGALKVYIDMTNLEESKEKIKNLYKLVRYTAMLSDEILKEAYKK